MRFSPTDIPEVLYIEPQVYGDARGFFMETYQKIDFRSAGIDYEFVQDNHSGSRKGILRGLHYQIQNPQGKLVRAVCGEVFDVAVDIRRSSATFGRWVGKILSSDNKAMLWVPPGFAHGFYVLSEWAEIVYKATDFYAPQWERSIAWNDPTIGVSWPINQGEEPLLSNKDREGLLFSQAELYD